MDVDAEVEIPVSGLICTLDYYGSFLDGAILGDRVTSLNQGLERRYLPQSDACAVSVECSGLFRM